MTKSSKDIIKYHLWTEKGSFLLELHENYSFNKEKFNELLKSIDDIKKEQTDDYIELMHLFFEKITYMYDILRDLYVHPNALNISKEKYYIFLLKLKDKVLHIK
jgi:uncharacterized protein (UPF0305 family)